MSQAAAAAEPPPRPGLAAGARRGCEAVEEGRGAWSHSRQKVVIRILIGLFVSASLLLASSSGIAFPELSSGSHAGGERPGAQWDPAAPAAQQEHAAEPKVQRARAAAKPKAPAAAKPEAPAAAEPEAPAAAKPEAPAAAEPEAPTAAKPKAPAAKPEAWLDSASKRRRRSPLVVTSQPALHGHPRWRNNRSHAAPKKRAPKPRKPAVKQKPRVEQGKDEEEDEDDEDDEDEDEDDVFIGRPTGVMIPPRNVDMNLTLPSNCRRAARGEKCYMAVRAAQDTATGDPGRHRGLSRCSSFEEFQEDFSSKFGAASHECGVPCQARPLPASVPQCHIPVSGEWCYEVVQWALLYGIKEHPEWYPGLKTWNSFEDFQRLFYKGGWGEAHNGVAGYAKCGPPCETPKPDPLRPMRSTPDGVCMYELPTKFNLELRDSVFRQREPKATPLKNPRSHLWGLHEQNQFALERVFYDRMQVEASTLRKPSACKMFYVPYFTEWETGDVMGVWKFAYRPWLENELFWHLVHYGHHRRRRCNIATPGHDHFIVMGRTTSGGFNFLNNGRFRDMVKLAIEDTHPGRWNNIVAVPYPSWFHYSAELEPPPGGPVFVEEIRLDCKIVQDIASRVCYQKQTCSVDTRWVPCGGMLSVRGKYRCGKEVKEIRTDLRDPLRTRVVFSCRIGPCWLTNSCEEACEQDWTISGKGRRIEPWQEFWRLDHEDGTFSLKTSHGRFVSVRPDGTVQGSGSGTGWWEKLRLAPLDGGAVAIKTWHGTHLSLNKAGDVEAVRRSKIPEWARFKIEKTSRGAVAFRTAYGRYLTAEKYCASVWEKMGSPPIVIIGSAKSHEVVRVAIIQQCEARPRDCVYIGTGSRDRSSGNIKDRISRFAEVLTTSLFCINPPGDTPTRKGIFDSLVLGCIPVITDSRSLDRYRWHLPDWWAVCVFVSEDILAKNFNIVDYLMRLKKTDIGGIQWKLTQIQRVAFSLQYSTEPTDKANRGPDAFDVALQRVAQMGRRLG